MITVHVGVAGTQRFTIGEKGTRLSASELRADSPLVPFGTECSSRTSMLID